MAYAEIANLIAKHRMIKPAPHHLPALLRDHTLAKNVLESTDVVVCTAGPYAHFYAFLRDRFGLSFRLIRDVRTALWTSYLLQEALIRPYVRAGDSVIHSSVYSRDLFAFIFSPPRDDMRHVCYPLTSAFPLDARSTWRKSGRGVTTIGFVGRMTADKNFAQATDLIAALEKRHPSRYRLVAIGENPLHIQPDGFVWLPPVDHHALWDHYANMDVLFFPSTSTLETFGRVLVEASFVGTPVLSSSHGASAELIATACQLPTNYYFDETFNTHVPAAMGSVSISHAMEAILSRSPLPQSEAHMACVDDASRFLRIVTDAGFMPDFRSTAPPAPGQKEFLESMCITGIGTQLSPEAASAIISRLMATFVSLHGGRAPRYYLALARLLLNSNHSQRTLAYVRGSLRGEDYSRIGGVDVELAHLCDFYPSFELQRRLAPGDTPGVRERHF